MSYDFYQFKKVIFQLNLQINQFTFSFNQNGIIFEKY